MRIDKKFGETTKYFDSKHILYLNEKKNIVGEFSKKRLLENILSKEFDGYRKENIRFERFLPYVKNAIENEKRFCEDIHNLNSELGSNVGVLLGEIIDNNEN